MKFGLEDHLIKEIQAVFSKYPQIDCAILYGSRAMGTYQAGSDIDLTLRGSAALDLAVLSKITNDLDDLLTPYKFDVSIFNDIENKELLAHIKRVGIEVYP